MRGNNNCVQTGRKLQNKQKIFKIKQEVRSKLTASEKNRTNLENILQLGSVFNEFKQKTKLQFLSGYFVLNVPKFNFKNYLNF